MAIFTLFALGIVTWSNNLLQIIIIIIWKPYSYLQKNDFGITYTSVILHVMVPSVDQIGLLENWVQDRNIWNHIVQINYYYKEGSVIKTPRKLISR